MAVLAPSAAFARRGAIVPGLRRRPFATAQGAEASTLRQFVSWKVARLKELLDWAHFRRVIFAARAGMLAVSLYSLGYAAGMNAYAQDPDGCRRKQALEVLKGIGGLDKEGRPRFMPNDAQEVRAVHEVFPRILRSAREELKYLQAEVDRSLEKEPDSDDLKDRRQSFQKAQVQLDSWREDGFVVIDVNTPNAFVQALVPRMVFVHRGLFRMVQLSDEPADSVQVGSSVAVPLNDGWTLGVCSEVRLDAGEVVVRTGEGEVLERPSEQVRFVKEVEGVVQTGEQLAMLLGHEISHVIHNHAEERTAVLATAAGCNLVLLAVLDPTGFLSFAFDVSAALVSRFGFHLPMSRANELEADATGLRICARAGFDPRTAPEFFDRMLQLEEANGGTGVASWASTHPRTEDRARTLRSAAEEAVGLFEEAVAKRSAEAAITSAAQSRRQRHLFR